MARSRRSQETTHPPEIERFIDWQDHQYDQGYWTGGRIPPMYLSDRPNRFGWVLIVSGVVTVVMVFVAIFDSGAPTPLADALSNPWGLYITIVAGLSILSGVRLVRGRPRRARRSQPPRT